MDIASPFELAETRRLTALHALDLLDTAPEEEFDAITRLAAAATGSASAFLSLIDRDRMWVKAQTGGVPTVVPRLESMCDTTIGRNAPLVVDDLVADPRFCDHWLIEAGTRFYAGLPLRVTDRDGVRQPVGALCVLHPHPRTLNAAERQALDDLAVLAESLMVSRGAAREAVGHAVALERQQRIFRQAERMARIGWWRLNLADERVEWSDGVFRIHDLDVGQDPTLASACEFYPPQARAVVSRSLAHTIETGQSFDFEVDFLSAKGVERRVRSMGEIEWTDGYPAAVIGVFQDVSEEYALVQALRRSADSDPLTHMPNRTVFNRTLETAVAAARAHAAPLALVLIDLDDFKCVNDTFGHPAGDEVLKTIARRLHAPWLKDCCSARLGGDEFAVIVDDPALLDDAAALVARLENELRITTMADDRTMETGASIGLAMFEPARFASLRDFIHAADESLYAAKRRRIGERRAA
ncbi:diguanylate cyclase domain-containing protein [Sphingomonas sp.]|uniref:diguanylate cyclase domain-containing protein n=1 Tax=Sphingomonas sp. TaxID=28214 RepID=UPI0035BC58B4